MLRRILVPLDSSPFTDAALNWSCFVAKITGAEITGLAVMDIPGIEKSVGSAPLGGIYFAQHLVEKKEQLALEQIRAILDNFEKKCQSEGVAYKLSERQGNPSEEIIRHSVFYDLVVLGLRTYYNMDKDAKQGESVERVMGASVTPIFAVPDRFVIPEDRVKTLLAFDGCDPSIRAMHSFTRLVGTVDFDVTILMSREKSEDARWPLKQAEGFLKAHGFDKVKSVWTPRQISDEIQESYIDNTNLFVLGAHSKAGLVDFRIGSLSKYLIHNENKYLLIGL